MELHHTLALYCSLWFSLLIQVNCDAKGAKTAPVNDVKGSNWKHPPTRATLTTSAKWIQEALNKHNYYRDKHQAPRLILNNTLSEISQAWANYLLQRGTESFNRNKSIDFFDHNYVVTKKESIGENLYYAVNFAQVDASLPVRLWYEEIKDYDFLTGRRKSTSHPKAQIGHLTQLIWKETRQLGTAFATTKLNNGQILTFVCANYYPAGNVNGYGAKEKYYYLENVLPLLNGDKVASEENEIIIPIRWPGLKKTNITTENSWIQNAADAHNVLRANHGVPALKLNQELGEISQSWTAFLLKSGITSFNNHKKINLFGKNDQTSKFGIGENIMYFLTDNDQPIAAESVVNLWYQEIQYYNFTTGSKRFSASKSASIESFTQIVWKTATEFSMTYSSSKLENGQFLTFVVANYYPSKYAPGITWERNRIENVPPPNSGKRVSSILNHTNVSKIIYIFYIYIVLLK